MFYWFHLRQITNPTNKIYVGFRFADNKASDLVHFKGLKHHIKVWAPYRVQRVLPIQVPLISV